MHRSLNLMLVFIAAFTLLKTSMHGQTVVHSPQTSGSLEQQVTWAQNEAKVREYKTGYWIGYNIQRLMEENSFTGTFNSDEKRNHPSLMEIIFGLHKSDSPKYNTGASHQMVKKDVGILFHFAGTGSSSIDEIIVSNLSLHVDLKTDSLIWIGAAENEQSVKFLQQVYGQILSSEIKEDIIAAIGMHEESERAFKFLKDIVESDAQTSLREQAVFWLGQQHNEKALSVLIRAARSDKSEDVRENAIFALSEIDDPSSVDTLIVLAKGGNDREVRNKSMFWLAQKASGKAVKTITAIAEDDDDSEVQKQAVFALSQLSDNESIPALIQIARTHRNPEIRKTAIFWLGQSENQAALEAIVDIIKN
jgi:hypothetical protein